MEKLRKREPVDELSICQYEYTIHMTVVLCPTQHQAGCFYALAAHAGPSIFRSLRISERTQGKPVCTHTDAESQRSDTIKATRIKIERVHSGKEIVQRLAYVPFWAQRGLCGGSGGVMMMLVPGAAF